MRGSWRQHHVGTEKIGQTFALGWDKKFNFSTITYRQRCCRLSRDESQMCSYRIRLRNMVMNWHILLPSLIGYFRQSITANSIRQIRNISGTHDFLIIGCKWQFYACFVNILCSVMWCTSGWVENRRFYFLAKVLKTEKQREFCQVLRYALYSNWMVQLDWHK